MKLCIDVVVSCCSHGGHARSILFRRAPVLWFVAFCAGVCSNVPSSLARTMLPVHAPELRRTNNEACGDDTTTNTTTR